jgi:hypothetical protein
MTGNKIVESDYKLQHVRGFLNLYAFFFVSLAVHLSITLAKDQIDAQIFNKFITILYMYMFQATYCSKHVHVEDCNKCIKNLCIKLVIG